MRVGLSTTTIYRLMAAGRFPRQRQLGGNSVAWLENELEEWIAGRPVAERPGRTC
jgi:prophage regulatory protein